MEETNIDTLLGDFMRRVMPNPLFTTVRKQMDVNPFVCWHVSVVDPDALQLPTTSRGHVSVVDPDALQLPTTSRPLNDTIIDAFIGMQTLNGAVLIQFWAMSPKLVLSVENQPFAVGNLSNHLADLRSVSWSTTYQVEVKENMIVMLGLEAECFNGLLPLVAQTYIGTNDTNTRVFLPVSKMWSNDCLGVVEINAKYETMNSAERVNLGNIVLSAIEQLKRVGLDIIGFQERIQHMDNAAKIIQAKPFMEHAIRSVCDTHHIPLAQVWICSSDVWICSSDATSDIYQQAVALKLQGYLRVTEGPYVTYASLTDVFPLTRYESVLRTVTDGKSRLMMQLYSGMLADLGTPFKDQDRGIFVIFVKSDDVVKLAIEFVGVKLSSNYIKGLELILDTLSEKLPTSYKFSSGGELGNESLCYVYDPENETRTREREPIKLFQRTSVVGVSSSSTSREKGKELVAVSRPVEVQKRKPGNAGLTLEDLEGQFGNSRTKATRNLKVGWGTLEKAIAKYLGGTWPETMEKSQSEKVIGKYPGGKCPETMEKSQSKRARREGIKIKTVLFKNNMKWTRIFKLPNDASINALEQEVSSRYELPMGSFFLQYVDEENDTIMMTRDDEFDYYKTLLSNGRIVVINIVEKVTHKGDGTSAPEE